MNKFKKILLGTMLGLAVTAPAVGMVGCSKVAPENPPVVEPEDPEEETQELSMAKVKEDSKKEFENILNLLMEKNRPEFFNFADRMSVIDQQIFEAQKELNEIAEFHNVVVESIEINELGDAWVAKEGVEESRVEALINSIKSLTEERSAIQDEVDEFVLSHEEDELDFGVLADRLEGVLYLFDTRLGGALEDLSVFKQDRYYINEDDQQFYGVFKIDENTLVAVGGNGLFKIEYKDGKLSRIEMLQNVEERYKAKVFDFSNGIYAFAGIKDNLVEDAEDFYSPFKNFNDGNFTLADLNNMAGYVFEFSYTKFAGGEVSENDYQNDPFGGESVDVFADSVKSDILDILKVFQECGLKLPMSDVVDGYSKMLPAFNIQENYEGNFSWDDFDVGPRSEEENETLQKFFDFTDSLYSISDALYYEDLQIVQVPKFEFSSEYYSEPKGVSADAIMNYFTQVGLYDMVVLSNLTGDVLRNLDVFEGLQSGNVTFKYIDQHGSPEAKIERTESNYVETAENIYNYFNSHSSENIVTLGSDQDNSIGLSGVDHGDFSIIIGSVTDEEGNEFFGLIPFKIDPQE